MILRHLLPKALAWDVTINKQLRQFVSAFDVLETDAVAFFDAVYLDIWPASTRQLTAWERQFNLPELGLSEADRRIRLAATWAAVGGQSPRYIQDTLQASGFDDVYVHESWDPVTKVTHNPLTYLQQTFPGVSPGVDCGEPLAECGEPSAECGDTTDPPGYPLVNKVPDTARVVPVDPTKWPFFVYYGGEVFGTLATVNPSRRAEFETLCLKLSPTHLWLGMLITYT